MPKATVDVNDTERHDLETCEEGYVVLRRMNYGEKLTRQQLATDMAVTGGGGRGRKAEEAKTNIKIMSRAIAEFEFKNCIVDHNLTDANDTPLDFRRPQTLDQLDPRIGDEINKLIADMNNFEEDDDGGN
jgi:hypothetical protein